MDAVTSLGWKIVNIDCIVFAQRPKLLTHRQVIRQRLADILDIDVERVGLQAKTGEGIGAIGTEEAIAAQCVALLEEGDERSEVRGQELTNKVGEKCRSVPSPRVSVFPDP